MPVEYVIHPDLELVLSQAYGRVTDSDLLEHERQLRSDEQFAPHFNQLFDFTQLNQNEITSQGVRALADRNPFGAGSKRALIADQRDLETFGLLRMFEILTSDQSDESTVQYDDLRNAAAWFGLTNVDGSWLPSSSAQSG